MSNYYFLILVAVILGIILPLQVAINSKLGDAVANPLLAAFASFFVGTVSLLAYILITGIPLSKLAGAKDASPIAWTGGVLGAIYVAGSIILLPKLGVALTISLILAGQMLMSVAMDHFGLFGLPVKEISLARVAGVLLIVIGVVLIRKY
ncbi:MAG: DMT family transporter [Acidobacteria bacterium]|nr:DMT family transporter [Acidobacteriota bacterium]